MWWLKKKSSDEAHAEHLNLREDLLYVLALIGPIMTIPQAYLIWGNRSAEGVSIYSWGTYLGLTVFWLFHGVKLRDKLLIVNNIVGLLVNIAVVSGIVIYSL